MHTNTLTFPQRLPNTRRWLIALLAALAVALSVSATAHAAAPCTPTRSFELWAETGTLTLPDGPDIDALPDVVNIWGYTVDSAPPTVPGPTLTVSEGTCVQVTLHNTLSEATSVAFHGQGLPADTVGVNSGSDNIAAPYIFLASRPGTFLYEAGLTTNGARQVAMGLYGALIVQPLAAPTTYDSEAVLVLSEIDPALNAAPTTFNMGEYKPRYWLINGQVYPGTDPISAASDSTLLVRYVNAGLNENSMGLLGLGQQVVAADGYALPNPYTVVAETIPPGGTMETLVSIPATAANGTQYALYSAAQHLDNDGASYGGQLMYLTVATPIDQPPTVNAGVDQTITLPATASLDGTVTDDSLSALTTVWTMTSGPGIVTFTDASLVDTTASFDTAGDYVLRLTATDGTGSVLDEVAITVAPAPIDLSPTVDAGVDQTITLPATASLDGTVTDDSLSALTTVWTMTSGPGIVTFTDASLVDTTASFDTAGDYVLRLTATDGTGSVLDEVAITVAPAPIDLSPTVDAGVDQTITLPASATLDGTVTDDSVSALTTVWSMTSGPGTVTFTDASLVDTTASFSVDGIYVLRLTATDGTGSVSDEVTITVSPNPANTMHVGDLDNESDNRNGGGNFQWRARVRITVHDGNHALVGGAVVTGTLTYGTTSVTLTCTTAAVPGGGNAGTCRPQQDNIPDTTGATFTVTSVTKVGSTYNSSANHDPDTGAQASTGTVMTLPAIP